MKKFKHLIALVAIVLFAACLVLAGAPVALGVATVGLWQLSQFAMSKRPGFCYTTVLTPEQLKEFEGAIKSAEDFMNLHGKTLEGMKALDIEVLKSFPTKLAEEQKRNDELAGQVKKLQKSLLNDNQGVKFINGIPFVSEPCAKYLGSMFAIKAIQDNKVKGAIADTLLARSAEFLGIEVKAAMAATDVPLPVAYGQQIAELVYHYGTARKACTIYPLSGNSMKLPRLKTGEPQFAFIAVSGSVPEKVPQSEFITFTPGKAGGIVRIPSEIEEDSIFDLGQFVARYIARQMAYWEDYCLFRSDGTSTYNSIASVGTQATTDSTVLQLAATNSSSDKITLANCRNIRTLVTGAVLQTAKYYAHPSMEALFVSFNTSATVTPYVRNGQECRLDGFEIVWTPIMPVYSTSATLNTYQIYFGDLSWWYFGVRRDLDVQTSRDVYFATDEVGVRALERFDIHAMGQKCSSALQLSAS